MLDLEPDLLELFFELAAALNSLFLLFPVCAQLRRLFLHTADLSRVQTKA